MPPQTGLQTGNLSSIERLTPEADPIYGYWRLRGIGRQSPFCKTTSITAVRSSHQTGSGLRTTRMIRGNCKFTFGPFQGPERSIRFPPQEEAIRGGGVMEKNCST